MEADRFEHLVQPGRLLDVADVSTPHRRRDRRICAGGPVLLRDWRNTLARAGDAKCSDWWVLPRRRSNPFRCGAICMANERGSALAGDVAHDRRRGILRSWTGDFSETRGTLADRDVDAAWPGDRRAEALQTQILQAIQRVGCGDGQRLDWSHARSA